ncbi:MAG: D-aminoacylase [Eubacteriales bacterium]|nr:D-aminoacylase [Eubacteriales bacterium]
MDYILRNARIVDGTGRPSYLADIGISGDTIAKIGTIDRPAGEVIDLAGRLVTPGFIDSHSHDDGSVFLEEAAYSRIPQGITLSVVGQCGSTVTPLVEEQKENLRNLYFDHVGGRRFAWNWHDTATYIQALEAAKTSYNMLFLIGQNTLRIAVMGTEERSPAAEELAAMKDLLDVQLSQGAGGLSLGMNLSPAKCADIEELVELAKVVKKHDAVICAHRRNEASMAVESIEEMIEIARRTGVRMVCSHVKVMGAANRGKVIKILSLLHQARKEGLDISFDAYPYIEGFVQLYQIFPRWVWCTGAEAVMRYLADPQTCQAIHDEICDNKDSDCYYNLSGGASGIRIRQCPEPLYNNKTLAEITSENGADAIYLAMDIIRTHGPEVMMLCDLQNREENNLVISHPCCMIGSDGASTQFFSHPRYLGSFSRVLDFYVRQTGLLSLEEAVYKCTGLAAKCYRIKDRGVIAVGNKADLVVIDWDNFEDRTSFDETNAYSKGIDYVFLNGVVAARDGVATRAAVGQIIR